jgi:EpsI family protein
MTDSPQNSMHGLGISRRHFVIGALLASASAGSYVALPKVRYAKIDNHLFESWIPEKLGSWTLQSVSGVVLPPPDALSDRLYDNLITRVYERPGMPVVMMLIAYNNKQDGVLQLHRPEICYPAGGYRLSPTQPITLTLAPGREVPANVFTAVGVQRTEQVLYWTRLGESFPRSWLDQRLSVMRANLEGAIPDGAMMRVSLIGSDQGRALDILRDFLATFFNAVPSRLQQVLIGGNR